MCLPGSTHRLQSLQCCDLYADRSYPSAERSQMLKALGYREHIQCKAKAGQALSECQKGRNKRIARTRARVEHPFAQMRHMGGKLIRTIGQARATVAMTMMAACYNVSARQTHVDRRWRPLLTIRCQWAASGAARARRYGWPCAWAAL